MMRKHSSHAKGYTVVDINGVSHIFAAAAPRCEGPLDRQLADALQTIKAVNDEEGVRGAIVHQAVFLREEAHLEACRRLIGDFYGDQMPATTYIFQPPCCQKLVAIEALGVGRASQEVAIERISDQLVVTGHGGVRWIHCGHVTPDPGLTSLYDQSLSAFRRMARLLEQAGVAFRQVIRTWLYLGDIVGMEGQRQRYQELNRARTDYYQDIEFTARNRADRPAYPASTGIGASNHGLVMSCIALDDPGRRVSLIPLENPLQKPAFDYSARYSPKSPKFSRAMALANGRCSAVFVSGTASITDSETRWIGDVERQTQQTLDNIEALIAQENFAAHGWPELGATLEDLALVRVYAKRQEDYPTIRRVCEARVGETPTIYAVADVCRPELLVEIEGVAFVSR